VVGSVSNQDKTYNDAATLAGAQAARDLYLSYVEVGFTRKEALELVKSLLSVAAISAKKE